MSEHTSRQFDTNKEMEQPQLPNAVLMLGVGGMGMAPLAIYLAQAGVRVVGSDDSLQSHVRALLEAAGVTLLTADALATGLGQGAFKTIELCAISSAIGAQHRLLSLARAAGLHVVRRGELLARVSRTRKLVAVVGSHGKTTTTGLLIAALEKCGLTFDYVLGGLFQGGDPLPARCLPHSPWLIAEVDESDGTIEHFAPYLTLAVNFDWDHTDRYATATALRETFAELFARTATAVVYPADDPVLPALIPPEKAQPCEIVPEAKVRGFNGYNESLARCITKILLLQESVSADKQSVQSVQPVQTAQSTQAVADRPDLFSGFGGIFRRQEWLYVSTRLRIMTDYAHHPREVAALLDYLRACYPANHLVAVFQPHRYTRTRQFAREFAAVLGSRADAFFLMPVYAASETAFAEGRTEAIVAACVRDQSEEPIQVYPPYAIAAECREALNAQSLDTQALNAPLDETNAATTLVFVGAGDIDAVARKIAADCTLRDSWQQQLSAQTQVRLGEPLARRTTIRLGGSARFYAEPASAEDLGTLLRLAKEAGLKVWLLGRGSNLIVPDEGFDGLVISFNSEAFRRIEKLPDGSWYVGSGVALKRLCAQAAREGLSGWEFLEGIPGTVGGALRMNAGAMGKWMFDVVEAVDVLLPSGAVQRRPRSAFSVGYRKCEELSSGGVAVGAVLRPDVQVAVDAVRQTLDNYASRRKETQPREPSAGCIFKNPQGHHAGALIDELGLKGLRVGGAEVSAVHGNFIINRGGATAADVLELVRQIRARVFTERGIELEPEALLVGKRWEDVL